MSGGAMTQGDPTSTPATAALATTRRIRALMIGMDWFPDVRDGGLNRYFFEQVNASPSSGIEGVALVSACQQCDGALSVRPLAGGGASLPARLGGARAQIAQAVREGIDVIDSHFALYTYPGLLHLKGLPIVTHFHGPFAAEIRAESRGFRTWARATFARRVELAVLKQAARVITLSHAFARIAREDYGVPRDRIRVIPGGLNLSAYLNVDRSQARARLGWPENRPILIAIRRLARRMGLEGLIDAMKILSARHPDVLLMIGGKGELAGELGSRIADAGLSEHVRLLGFIPEQDLPFAYAAANFSIVPTLALEGFGLITVESLASGTPVLGTSIGGTPEILRGLEPSLIFNSTEPEAIADRIIEALSGRIPVPSAQQCREYAARFDWAAVMPQIRAVFDEVLA
ncbi:MAG TPA: glycosyltransferase family 4 protein [Humisphaera sp.]|jgi:glycosyltransferase involved in cell wall biosynthesis|nr:glycosyltransferase family 4 protein [Humisphaera sp.]